MSPLPFPVRIAAGLVVTAVEQARELPRHAVELPVTAVSQALQVSMRVQQRITELAIKGDRALGTLRPADDVPSWATFDDDLADGADLSLPDPEPIAPPLPPAAPAGCNGTVSSLRPARTGIPIDRSPSSRPAAASNRAEASATVPAALPEYPTVTVPQLRGKLRTLSLDDLADLLAWETAHENRPPYVTMLTNRIATVSENR
ncbi:lipid droplet-associated protein [Pseudonocardia sp. EV170527-09]|uniref:lipid droplet-associated protein n=1 Tax=Pseudonocardia sp. EV170527-09 TaxID=2603411 RepID=UPI0011F2C45C|nr:lipid droplet-associated protein [Pseudonocardia sp. EV170527-09]KAA1031871.1 lipid droplet-associated protein [Pseudonocardia sp. EV170527-09]